DDPSGVYYDCRPAVNAPVAFLYPGQGSQYAGMLYGLRQALPGFEENLRKLDQIWRELAGDSLIDVIYGQSDDHLRDTRFAQPALGMISTAVRLSLEALGVRACWHAGHSYGEFSALCGAGCLDERLLLTLSRERGRLLAEAGDLVSGAMVALTGSHASIENLVASCGPGLDGANINSPEQVGGAGPVEAVVELADRASAAGLFAKRLKTSSAFHSSLMRPVAEKWSDTLQRVLGSLRPETPGKAFCNVTAAPY